MKASGKGGGRRKAFYEAICVMSPPHGNRGQKSNGSHYFTRTAWPKTRKPSQHPGCPQCRSGRVAIA